MFADALMTSDFQPQIAAEHVLFVCYNTSPSSLTHCHSLRLAGRRRSRMSTWSRRPAGPFPRLAHKGPPSLLEARATHIVLHYPYIICCLLAFERCITTPFASVHTIRSLPPAPVFCFFRCFLQGSLHLMITTSHGVYTVHTVPGAYWSLGSNCTIVHTGSLDRLGPVYTLHVAPLFTVRNRLALLANIACGMLVVRRGAVEIV